MLSVLDLASGNICFGRAGLPGRSFMVVMVLTGRAKKFERKCSILHHGTQKTSARKTA